MTPQYITIHSTGNTKSTARNERDWLTNPTNGRQASWHICVDEKEAIEAIPLNEVAWHAGDGRGPGNMSSISIEICESGDRHKTLQNAAELVAKILKERGWGIDRLMRHFDWSGKICPRIMADAYWAGWENFRNEVRRKMEDVKNKPSAWANDAWEWAKEEGLLDGTRPKDPITREEVAIILKRIMGRLK
jgi:N-acetylmuramoyl-L-alanine amidase